MAILSDRPLEQTDPRPLVRQAAAPSRAGLWRAAPVRLAVSGAALLLASGILSTLVSYDPALSGRFLALLAGGLLVGGAVVGGRLRPARIAGALALGGGALALYFLLQNDFDQRSKFAVVQALSAPLRGLVPDLGWHKPHPNIVAGVLETALPLSIGLLLAARGGRPAASGLGAFWRWAWIGGVALLAALCAFGLFMTESRGAWAALAGAGALAGLAALLQAGRAGRLARRTVLGAVGALGLGVAAAGGGLLALTLTHPPLLKSFLDRLLLYREALGLVSDYPFSGAGLGAFEPNFTRYILFYGSPPEPHAHDLWLNLWIVQGVAGVIGYGLLTAGVSWAAWRALRHGPPAPLFWASLVAWLTLLLHGLWDDVLSPALTLPLLIIVPALLLRNTGILDFGPVRSAPGKFWIVEDRSKIQNPKSKIVRLCALGIGAILVMGVFGTPLVSLAESNLGNLYQARVDLGGDAAPATAAAADRWLTAAWRTWPGNPSSVRRASFFYFTRGQVARAGAYQQATGAPVDEWGAMAYYFIYHAGQPAYGLSIAQAAADRGTTTPLAYYVLARAAAERGDWRGAAAAQQQAVQLDPAAGAETYVALGDWRRQAGDPAAARAAYQQALRLAPADAAAAAGLQQLTP